VLSFILSNVVLLYVALLNVVAPLVACATKLFTLVIHESVLLITVSHTLKNYYLQARLDKRLH
jgi:hypothetical protein